MLTEQFVKRYGTEKNGVFFFPTPEIVANISIEELREQKFSQRKAEYIVGLGRSIASGTLNLASIETKAEEEISAQLLPIRDWYMDSAKFLMFGLGRKTCFRKRTLGFSVQYKVYFN